MTERVKIEGDVFDIAARLKEIDRGYFVMYNLKTEKFEVWHGGRGRRDGICLVLPFSRLDARAVTEVYRTRAERAERLLREAEEHNLKLERRRRARIADGAAARFEDVRKLYIKEKY